MLPPGSFEGRVAVITGGSSGIGETIARHLAALGATVVLLGRRPDALREVVASIREAGGSAAGFAADVRDRERVEAVLAEVVDRYGRIDHLVNNAAGNFRVAPEEMSPNAWNAVVRIVLDGSWHCTQTVGRHLIARGGGGSVVSIGTTPALFGDPDTAHSASAKAGVLAMTKSLAIAWGRHGIRLNVVTPGLTDDTGAVSQLFAAEGAYAANLEKIPVGRHANRDEIAEAVTYLLSDHAGYVTGQNLVIDGGRSLGIG
ncbi:SDR family oxidoreductase [Peterkaempfera bronchialis]|uniref:Peroxisomal trans-2-enoyl-CoA reductase n=2 Tax=Peterkaempfera bronchialis TaxID=2126346 RepID=A0A345T6T4_9ACTN|nr:SDR family oxidoreductase [Peterkaempfera bronchialis]